MNLSETLRKGLEKHKRPAPERTRLVLLLDWGVRGTADTPRLSVEALRAWVEFCADRLSGECPSDMRLLSVLALQSSRERHPGIAAYVEQLRTDEHFAANSAFTMEHWQPLSDVGIGDLTNFLKDGHTSCPKDRIPIMPKLIWQKTKGRFNETVELIEKAEKVGVCGWLELYKQLKNLPLPDSGAVPSGELL